MWRRLGTDRRGHEFHHLRRRQTVAVQHGIRGRVDRVASREAALQQRQRRLRAVTTGPREHIGVHPFGGRCGVQAKVEANPALLLGSRAHSRRRKATSAERQQPISLAEQAGDKLRLSHTDGLFAELLEGLADVHA